MKVEDFAGNGPELRIERYFAGRTHAWGLFEDRFGTLRRSFTVVIDGHWDGRELTLDERFDYADGETDRRIWRIVRTGEGLYEGRADDVIGKAVGRSAGNALNWTYEMALKVGGGRWRVRFDDWMWLQPGDALINRANVYRWGVWIGTVSLFFLPEGRMIQPGAVNAAVPPPAAAE
ncbi:DUF3833 domain-containing protein (plasmid) [Azospirillum humicireducens]|uniref:DUF3833 domain-containing protein n=1 Tax=Azospirillum humicireducens TaxID=1226968 RepID=A0A2R4VW49_9PROT|nr:DUF3833 domain-containing protein [Azospirillum humicireducens]AWB08686.1 DUF3833 domain-containing protein [Azospirillum humicireducens]